MRYTAGRLPGSNRAGTQNPIHAPGMGQTSIAREHIERAPATGKDHHEAYADAKAAVEAFAQGYGSHDYRSKKPCAASSNAGLMA